MTGAEVRTVPGDLHPGALHPGFASFEARCRSHLRMRGVVGRATEFRMVRARRDSPDVILPAPHPEVRAAASLEGRISPMQRRPAEGTAA